jgi:hypothetical protein
MTTCKNDDPLARKRDVGLLKTDWKMGRTADEKLVGMPGMDLRDRCQWWER